MDRKHALIALCLLSLPACQVMNLRLWAPPSPPPVGAYQIERSEKIYYEGVGASEYRHRLDLFLPKDKKDFPVVVLVHGGAWMMGDNRCCGLYSSVGEFLASHGIGAVMPNYRQSPGIKHPEHIKDLARAVAWTKKNIQDHGGRPDRIFLAGHSAGGHLVALLATDERYLKAEGLGTSDIKGVFAISGVYRIPPGNMKVTLGGKGPSAFRIDQVSPLRDEAAMEKLTVGWLPLDINIFGPAFGDDPKVRADASPVSHVRAGLPPFRIYHAELELPSLPGMAEEFHKELVGKGCDARLVRMEKRNHNSIMFRAITMDDPVARALVEFVSGKSNP